MIPTLRRDVLNLKASLSLETPSYRDQIRGGEGGAANRSPRSSSPSVLHFQHPISKKVIPGTQAMSLSNTIFSLPLAHRRSVGLESVFKQDFLSSIFFKLEGSFKHFGSGHRDQPTACSYLSFEAGIPAATLQALFSITKACLNMGCHRGCSNRLL
jgi:hypothetical protein